MAVGRSLAHPVRYAVLAAGGLPVLVFPAPNLEFLAWFALVPGLLAMHRSPSAREAAVRGGWFGAGYFLAALWWVAPEIGPALLLVAAAFGALWPGVGLAVWGLLRPPVSAGRALAAVVVVPCVWLVIDLIRSWQALGGPWALYGASQWRHPVMLALAAVGGVWLITAVLVAANTAILVALVSARPATRVTGVAAAAALLAAGPLAYTLATPAAPVRPARQVRVALVQPGIVAGPRIRVNASQRLTTTLTTARAARPDLIVWGETPGSSASSARCPPGWAPRSWSTRTPPTARATSPRSPHWSARPASRPVTSRHGWCHSASTSHSGERLAG